VVRVLALLVLMVLAVPVALMVPQVVLAVTALNGMARTARAEVREAQVILLQMLGRLVAIMVVEAGAVRLVAQVPLVSS
jgi:hypothetical protein